MRRRPTSVPFDDGGARSRRVGTASRSTPRRRDGPAAVNLARRRHGRPCRRTRSRRRELVGRAVHHATRTPGTAGILDRDAACGPAVPVTARRRHGHGDGRRARPARRRRLAPSTTCRYHGVRPRPRHARAAPVHDRSPISFGLHRRLVVAGRTARRQQVVRRTSPLAGIAPDRGHRPPVRRRPASSCDVASTTCSSLDAIGGAVIDLARPTRSPTAADGGTSVDCSAASVLARSPRATATSWRPAPTRRCLAPRLAHDRHARRRACSTAQPVTVTVTGCRRRSSSSRSTAATPGSAAAAASSVGPVFTDSRGLPARVTTIAASHRRRRRRSTAVTSAPLHVLSDVTARSRRRMPMATGSVTVTPDAGAGRRRRRRTSTGTDLHATRTPDATSARSRLGASPPSPSAPPRSADAADVCSRSSTAARAH